MKAKTTVLFNDTDTERFDYTREYLFDAFGDEEGWATIEDVPDCVVEREMADSRLRDWEDFKDDMQYFLDKDSYLLTGVCGRWDGPSEGGKFIRTLEDLLSCIRHLDYLKIYDDNGHLYITGYHHDGQDRYELKRLTSKGYEFASRNYFAHDRQLHETIMGCNLYSALPRFAERLYGVV